MFSSSRKNFQPASNVELMLTHLPKQCTCSACTEMKNNAKNSLGMKRFHTVCKALGLAS